MEHPVDPVASAGRGASCWPPDSVSSRASSFSFSTGAGSSASFGPSAVRRRPASANGSRRELAAPGPAADERRRQRHLPQEPLARSDRPSRRSTRTASARRNVELVPDRLGKLERLDDPPGRGPSPRTRPPSRPLLARLRRAARPAQSFGYGAARKAPASSPTLRTPRPSGSRRRCSARGSRSSGRGDELASALVGNDQDLPRGAPHSPQRVRQTCARPRRRVDPRQSRRRRERAEAPPPRRRKDVRRHASRSRRSRGRRLDREPAVLEPAQDLLQACSAADGSWSTRTSSGRVASASPIRMPGLTPFRLGRGRHRPEQRLALGWRERRWSPRQGRAGRAMPRAIRSRERGCMPPSNVCSTRTHVPLSSGGFFLLPALRTRVPAEASDPLREQRVDEAVGAVADLHVRARDGRLEGCACGALLQVEAPRAPISGTASPPRPRRGGAFCSFVDSRRQCTSNSGWTSARAAGGLRSSRRAPQSRRPRPRARADGREHRALRMPLGGRQQRVERLADGAARLLEPRNDVFGDVRIVEPPEPHRHSLGVKRPVLLLEELPHEAGLGPGEDERRDLALELDVAPQEGRPCLAL